MFKSFSLSRGGHKSNHRTYTLTVPWQVSKFGYPDLTF
uniref:Uncharacterized protein n=1 Tax=Anguilla anguilla TaxID=7936 RepID=A0A0E9VUD6_ANGAN